MATQEQRLTTLEDFIQNHVATREQVDELEQRINDRFDCLETRVDTLDAKVDRLETDVRDIKTDVQEIVSYVRSWRNSDGC